MDRCLSSPSVITEKTGIIFGWTPDSRICDSAGPNGMSLSTRIESAPLLWASAASKNSMFINSSLNIYRYIPCDLIWRQYLLCAVLCGTQEAFDPNGPLNNNFNRYDSRHIQNVFSCGSVFSCGFVLLTRWVLHPKFHHTQSELIRISLPKSP